MRPFRHAILAGLSAILLLAAVSPQDSDDVHELSEPLRARFKMADGVQVDGSVSRWTDDWIDGSFGQRHWIEIEARDVWGLYRRLMDIEDASQWVGLGRVLLICALDQDFPDRIRANAEKAFHRAQSLDPNLSSAIDAARMEVTRIQADREELEKAIEEEKLSTLSPESIDWKAQPWPVLTKEEQDEAFIVVTTKAMNILKQVGLDIVPVETEYFLFYSDLPRREVAKWARELDRMYGRLSQIFALQEGQNIFWGKAVIFVFSEQDRFRLVEAQAFNHLASQWVGGLCHQIGPMVFVSFYRQADDFEFASILVHETVHGFMHRFLTPMRLPTWANEGFSDYVASISFQNSPVDQNRRQQGINFIRNQGDVRAILEMNYLDGSWPGPNAVGYSISYLMVSLMIQDQPRKFGHWVEAVKGGKDWKKALIEDFGVDLDTLIDRFVRYFRVND
ncbi:MAG: hypothetical protein O7G85_03460 [Planctomycetota bacterium]|nr:hypothetical protein [Planctomycetota bacterium]